MSRSSTPAPSDVEDNLDNEDDEADSEEERDVLSRRGSDEDEGNTGEFKL